MWHTQFCAIKAPTTICAPFCALFSFGQVHTAPPMPQNKFRPRPSPSFFTKFPDGPWHVSGLSPSRLELGFSLIVLPCRYETLFFNADTAHGKKFKKGFTALYTLWKGGALHLLLYAHLGQPDPSPQFLGSKISLDGMIRIKKRIPFIQILDFWLQKKSPAPGTFSEKGGKFKFKFYFEFEPFTASAAGIQNIALLKFKFEFYFIFEPLINIFYSKMECL